MSRSPRHGRFCRWSSAMDLNSLLRSAVDADASDLHLKVGQPPIVRRDGAAERARRLGAARSGRGSRSSLESVGASDPKRLAAFHETGELDTAYQAAGLPRFRVNAFRQRGEISFAFRVIPSEVPDFDELGLPAGVRRLAEQHRGLDPRHRRHGRRQDDDARLDDRAHQPDAPAAHRHDRGPDRDPPRRTSAASSTSARSGSTPTRSTRRSGACCGRTRT